MKMKKTNLIYIPLVILLVIMGCLDTEGSSSNELKKIVFSPKLFEPSLYITPEILDSLNLKKSEEDVPQFYFERNDTTVIFTLDFLGNEIASESWVIPFNNTSIDNIESFFKDNEVEIVANYLEVFVDLETGVKQVVEYPNSLKYFAAKNSNNHMFTCRIFDEEGLTFLLIKYDFPILD